MSEHINFNKELIYKKESTLKKNEVLAEMAELLRKNGFVKDTYGEALIKREEEYPTGLETGEINVAIPHVDVKHVNEAAIAVGILKNPIDFNKMEEPEKIIGGLKIILQLFPNAKGIIGIENNKPKAVEKLRELVKNESKIEVVELYTKYPQGGERSLIYACTGRKLNSSKLPADVGCIVDNTDTVISIYNAVAKSTPLIRRIVTITGDAVTTPQNFKVRTGMNYQELIEAAGGFKKEPRKVLSGGPMMGQALFTLDIPVTKASSSITTFINDEVEDNPETPCIKCGRCIDACPSFLVPVLMMEKALADDTQGFEKLNGMECVECGSCAYVCPAKRPLTQGFKYMRQAVAAKRRAAAAKKEVK